MSGPITIEVDTDNLSDEIREAAEAAIREEVATIGGLSEDERDTIVESRLDALEYGESFTFKLELNLETKTARVVL